jgi:hypothetical protein
MGMFNMTITIFQADMLEIYLAMPSKQMSFFVNLRTLLMSSADYKRSSVIDGSE